MFCQKTGARCWKHQRLRFDESCIGWLGIKVRSRVSHTCPSEQIQFKSNVGLLSWWKLFASFIRQIPLGTSSASTVACMTRPPMLEPVCWLKWCLGGADVTKILESKRCQTKHEIMNCHAFIFVYLLYVILHCWMLRVGSCVRRSGDPQSLFHIFD